VGLGRAVGARCRAGRSRGRAGPGGRHALLGGAGLTTGAHCRAGLGRGRHEVAEGLGRLGIGEGRRGETGPVHATEWGRAAGTWSRQGGWPAHGERGAGGGQCMGSREPGCRCVGSRQRGAEERVERGRTKKRAGFTNWTLMFLGRAKKHKDPPYVSQLPD
jgi:hypothetical protein